MWTTFWTGQSCSYRNQISGWQIWRCREGILQGDGNTLYVIAMVVSMTVYICQHSVRYIHVKLVDSAVRKLYHHHVN